MIKITFVIGERNGIICQMAKTQDVTPYEETAAKVLCDTATALPPPEGALKIPAMNMTAEEMDALRSGAIKITDMLKAKGVKVPTNPEQKGPKIV